MTDAKTVYESLDKCQYQHDCTGCAYKRGWEADCIERLEADAKELVEYRVPMKPKWVEDEVIEVYFLRCPRCGSRFKQIVNLNFCPNCGQAIDWGEGNDKID